MKKTIETFADAMGLGYAFRKASGARATTDDLVSAIIRQQQDYITEIIKRGCDINDLSKQAVYTFGGFVAQTTPLGAAIGNGDFKTAELLIQQGADVNTPDSNGQTPMMIGALYGCVARVGFLLDHGADMNKQNQSGQTALNSSMWGSDNNPVTALLVKAGAKLDIPDNDGALPLDYATLWGRENAKKLLQDHGAQAVKNWKPREDKADSNGFGNASTTMNIIMLGG